MTRFVKKGVKLVSLSSPILNEHQNESQAVLIYRSQVTEDRDWYDILDWFKENRAAIENLIALGDNFEKKIHVKYVSLEFK